MEKIKWRPDRRLLLVGLLALGGVLLLCLGGSGGADADSTRTDTSVSQRELLEAYTAQLRREIAELCDRVDGVSDVSVAVSLECGYEFVYATDTRSQSTGSAAGQVQYVTVGSGSSERTVYLTELLPRISGIGVVCRGGSDPEVVRRLTALLSAAYDVGSNKIYVTGT